MRVLDPSGRKHRNAAPAEMKEIAVVFDLFHTLISLEVPRAPGRRVSEILGVDPGEWYQVWTSDPDDYVFGRADVGERLRRLARRLNPKVTEAQIEEALAARTLSIRHAMVNVESEALEGLRGLRRFGCRLGLISNCGEDEVRAWPESPLAPLFDTVLFSCRVKLKKPDPAIYQLAATNLAVKPARCLYVGDGGSDEFAGARRAGMTPVLLTRHLEVSMAERIPALAQEAELAVRTTSELCRLLTGT
ncbi:MAG TPA: HAD family hydrolase [bacterium]|nr:HAD family hydrolase [bacterium]